MTVFAQKVQYRCGDLNQSGDNHIKPHLNIVNDSSSTISLSELTVRYYYTKDTSADQVFVIDYARVGGGNVTGTFFDDYVEIGFTQGAGDLLPGGESGEIQIRIHKVDWSNYDETDDYSFDAGISSYTDWDKITVYLSGILLWGVEPSMIPEPTPEPTPEPGVPVLKVQYKCGDTVTDDPHIKPHIDIVNTGTSTITLSDVTVRYYYSKPQTNMTQRSSN